MSTPAPIVCLVGGGPAVQMSLAGVIAAAGWQPKAFASADALLASPPLDAPGCLLLDADLHGGDPLPLQQRLTAERMDMPIIVITDPGDVGTTVRAMKAGAVEVLTRPLVEELVLSAVQEALDRSEQLRHRGADAREIRRRYTTLSSREREVMVLVVAGLLNKQVGGRLGISEITVKAHRGRVMRKMQADSLPALVTMAASLRLPLSALAAPRGREITTVEAVVDRWWHLWDDRLFVGAAGVG